MIRENKARPEEKEKETVEDQAETNDPRRKEGKSREK